MSWWHFLLYLPSSNIVAAVLGPWVAGWCSIGWGCVLVIMGYLEIEITNDIGYFFEGIFGSDGIRYVIGKFLVLLGFGILIPGFLLAAQHWRNMNILFSITQWRVIKSTMLKIFARFFVTFLLKFLLFPVLFLLTPVIYLYIKFLTIIKRDSKMIQSQNKIVSMGEAILEASPQYCLQMYVVLCTLDPTTSQWFSIITSAITLNIPNIVKYHENKMKEYIKWNEEFSKWQNIKNIFKTTVVYRNFLLPTLVIVLNSFGKILSISVIAVFLKFFTSFLFLGYLVILLPMILIILYVLKKKENDVWKQLGEATFLGFLTQTNLNDTGPAKICRIIVYYYTLIFYTSIVMVIVIICNIIPEDVVLNVYRLENVDWKNLALVKDITTLHIVCGVDIHSMFPCLMDSGYCLSKTIRLWRGLSFCSKRGCCCCQASVLLSIR